MTDNISYIIGFRAANTERTAALLFVLKRLRSYFPHLEIVVVEQDAVSKMKFDENLAINHLFIENVGLYNRSWGFNHGVKHSEKDVFVFADSDVFLSKEDFLTLFDATNHFEALTPNKMHFTNIALSAEKKEGFDFLDFRKIYGFAAGMMILTRQGFEKIGAWDERFEGWGGEDTAINHVLHQKLTCKTFSLSLYHIDHPRTIVDGNGQPKYKQNRNLSEIIGTFYGEALERYIQFLRIENNITTQENNFKTKDKLNFVLALSTYNKLDYLKKTLVLFSKPEIQLSIGKSSLQMLVQQTEL